MKFLFVSFALVGMLCAEPVSSEVELDSGKFCWFLETPSTESYPLVLAVDGSFDEERGPHSVKKLPGDKIALHDRVVEVFLPAKIGVVTVERLGICEGTVDRELFHLANTPTLRLQHHLEFVSYLRANPPKGWNGKLAILGISEGGPIAIKLADQVKPNACIALVGCGDQTFKEYIREVLAHIPPEGHETIFPNFSLFKNWQEAYEAQIEQMKINPDPQQFWFGQSYLYWSDALDLSEKTEFLRLECPIMVVTGSEDIGVASTERLLKEASGKDVVYLKVEGCGHRVFDPEWMIDQRLVEFVSRHFIESPTE